jgi:hypothetical protein
MMLREIGTRKVVLLTIVCSAQQETGADAQFAVSRRLAMRCAIALSMVLLVAIDARVACAQGDPIFDAAGFQQNRDYFSQQPFEHIDTLGGGLVLSFTDLMLPGNAGRDLTFQRSYNSKGGGGWRFGLAGVPMYVREFDWPLSNPIPPPPFDPATLRRPTLVTSDGAEHPTQWIDPPSGDPSTLRWVMSSQFWRYDRVARVAYLPDGVICQFDAEGRLTQFADPFGNVVALAWGDGTLQVRQDLDHGGTQSRVVNIVMNDHPAVWARLPLSMAFNGKTWTYEGSSHVIPPVGRGWDYGYNDRGELNLVRTPHGGEVSYVYGDYTFERNKVGQPNPTPISTRVVVSRAASGGTWTYTYSRANDGEHTTIETPSHAHVVYVHNLTVSEGDLPPDGEWGVRKARCVTTTPQAASATSRTPSATW